jgi:hypothetical protein
MSSVTPLVARLFPLVLNVHPDFECQSKNRTFALSLDRCPVDNFTPMDYLTDAYLLGKTPTGCKCLIYLNIPPLGIKSMHNRHFIQRALC